jgi:hypothetical protein
MVSKTRSVRTSIDANTVVVRYNGKPPLSYDINLIAANIRFRDGDVLYAFTEVLKKMNVPG